MPSSTLMNADTIEFLTRERAAIVGEAEASVARMRSHYEAAGVTEVRRRLDALFDTLLESLAAQDLGPVIALAREVAGERFTSGYDLTEVQSAFNALEAATWTHVLAELDPGRFAKTLGLVSTILGAGKDALGREYVSLATDAHAPSLDLRALFAGTAGV